ncbi:MAG: hypothetical protein AB7K36_02380 [Chloroflexota bacterium]
MQQQGEFTTRVIVSDITPATVAGSRFGYQVTVTGGSQDAGLLEAARAAILAHGGRTETDAPPVLMAEFGSQLLTRLLGAFLAPARFWPMRMVCEVLPGEQPTLRLTASEAFGFGSLIGVEGRFRTRCQALLTDVSRDVYANLERARVSAS